MSAETTDHNKKSARYTDYLMRLHALGPKPMVRMYVGGDAYHALKQLLVGSIGSGDHYVYFHRDTADHVFYVGKGKGHRAWSKDRDAVWHHYVKTRSAGEYEVEIVRYFAVSDDAESFEADCMAAFADTIVNHAHAGRSYDRTTLQSFHALRKANWRRIGDAMSLVKTEPERAEASLRAAIAACAKYARLSWEVGLKAELSAEVYPNSGMHLNAADIAALDRLTLLLKRQGRHAELVSTTDEFFSLYPEATAQDLSQRIAARAEASRRRLPVSSG